MSNAVHIPRVAALLLAILVLTACSGDSVSRADRAAAPTPIDAPAGVGSDGSLLTLETVYGGDATGLIVTDHRGFVVYGVTGETADGEPVCAGDCLDVWMPVEPRQGTVGVSLDPALYRTYVRPDGIEQVVYADIPLYLWSGDREIGITGGAGIAGTWFALTQTAGFVSG